MTEPSHFTSPQLHSFYIARQPIYDRQRQLIGYELLYRDNRTASHAHIASADDATTNVMLNAFLELGLDTLVGKQQAFINLSHSFIIGSKPLPFGNKQVVLEILEDIPVSDDVIEGLRRLVERGYTIALDDFTFRPELEPLLKLAHIIKVDVLNKSPAQLTQEVAHLRPFPVRLLAEKVESHEMHAICRELGFDYFQGYFYCKPHIIEGRSLPSSRLVILNMLAKLQQPDIEMRELEGLIVQDAALTYRLLRYVNSAFFGLPREVASVQHALAYVGTNVIRNWVSLLLISRVDDKPRELMLAALLRARMCEYMASKMSLPEQEQYFTIGLFSMLDAMMDQPMGVLLNAIPFVPHIKQALIDHSGTAGNLLSDIVDYTEGHWDALDARNIDLEMLRDAYLDALSWAEELLRLLVESKQ